MKMLPVRIILMAMLTLLLTAFLGWTVPSVAAPSATSFVDDSGKFFSEATIKELTSRIERIKNATGKEVYVVTVGKLTGKTIDEAAVLFGRTRQVNGIVIYISKEPSKLAVKVGTNTARLITNEKQLMVRDTMLQAFKEKRFDDGILQAVGLLENQMRHKSVGMTTNPNKQPPIQGEPRRAKGTNWLLLLILIGGGFLILRIILRAMSGGQAQQGLPGGASPGLGGQPGMPGGGGGGGFMNSLLGGLGGAMLGNWLFNSFSGHHNDSVSAGNMTGQDSWGGNSNDASSGWQNDDAGAFSSSNDSADWGGGSDFGGGGGDF